MTLRQRVANPTVRALIAADAVAQAEAAVRERGGVGGKAATVGLDTVNRLRPNFLKLHVNEMLPAWAAAIDTYWQAPEAEQDRPAHLVANADAVTESLLAVSDAYVGRASDPKAIAVYNRLRPHAPERIATQMPRIAEFVERHSQD